MSKYEIYRIIVAKVVDAIREAIPKLFGLVKTALIEEFDRRYVIVLQVATAAAIVTIIIIEPQGTGAMQYRDFSYTKPPEFRGIRDLIITSRWISNVDVYFFTCSCPEAQKVKFVLNLLCWGAKD